MFSFLYHYQDVYQTWLYTWVTRRVSYKKQKQLTLREHLSSPPALLVGSVLLIFLVFCVVLLYMCLFALGPVLWCPLWFPHKTMFGSSLPPVVCRRTHVFFTLFVFACVMWCPTHIVLCFVLFSSSCVHYVVSFSGLTIVDCPFSVI
jgi:hypothetical protein